LLSNNCKRAYKKRAKFLEFIWKKYLSFQIVRCIFTVVISARVDAFQNSPYWRRIQLESSPVKLSIVCGGQISLLAAICTGNGAYN
jgi:hypothetical protein